MADRVGIGDVQGHIDTSPSPRKTSTTGFVRARKLVVVLYPVDLCLFCVFSSLWIGGAKHCGQADRVSVEPPEDKGVSTRRGDLHPSDLYVPSACRLGKL